MITKYSKQLPTTRALSNQFRYKNRRKIERSDLEIERMDKEWALR